MTRLRVILAATVALAVITGWNPAQATSVSPLVGITISPAIEQLQVAAGQVNANFSVTATNHTAKSAVLRLTTNDFTALNQTGAVSFYGKNYDPTTNPHGLASSLKPRLTEVALSPGQTQTIPVTIGGINALAAGGHYGALVYFVQYPSVGGGTQAQVSNNQVLSTLVFLTTSGQGTQTLQLSHPLISSFYSHWPSSVQFLLSNTGNTQTTPRGTVTVNSGAGARLAKGLINPDSGLVLPGGERLFNVTLSPEHRPRLFGHDKVVITYRSDGSSQTHSFIQAFWYLNLPLVALIVTVLGLAVWGAGRLRRFGRRRRPARGTAVPLSVEPAEKPVAKTVSFIDQSAPQVSITVQRKSKSAKPVKPGSSRSPKG